MNSKRVFFPGLNSIRCVAVLLVIFAHIESFKNKSGLFSLFKISWLKELINNIGHQGVIVFFALSGFLITYLLLVEKERTYTISIKKFYIRRILRIWPLYFLIVILGFFVFPHILNPDYFPVKTNPNLWLKLFLTISFLPNAVFFIYGHIFSIGVLWSIGTEEQFYLVWPYLVKKLKLPVLPKVLLVLLGTVVVVKVLLWLALNKYNLGAFANKACFVGYHFLEYDAMIIGAITALMYFLYKQHLTIVYNKWLQAATYGIVGIMLFKLPDLGPFTNLIFASMYAVIILNISTNTGTLFKATIPAMEFLGKISFAMYLYHSICIAVCMALLNRWHNLGIVPYNFALYGFSLASTIIISTVSYYVLEKPVLNYKTGFMIVKSGSTAI